MKRFAVLAGLLAVLTAASVATVAAPASAASLQLTSLSVKGPGGTVSLTCDPDGGTHPNAAKACADVNAYFGQIGNIPPIPGMLCLAVWDPTPISVTGFWRGLSVRFSDIETNPGCARISHGQVFNY